MSREFLISLVIPTYNKACLLEKALCSVAAVDMDEPDSVEVIVVDNNSTDSTKETVEKTQAGAFPFELVYLSEPNQGVAYARNRGLFAARGKYVVFMDDDQLIDVHYLSNVERAFRETDAVCIGGKIEYYNSDGIPEWLKNRIVNFGQLDLGNDVKILSRKDSRLKEGNLAVQRDIIKDLGGFDVRFGRRGDELTAGEGDELQDRLYDLGKIVAYCPYLLQYNYLRPEKFSKKYWRRHQFGSGRSVYLRGRDDWKNANKFFNAPRTLWWFLFTRDFRDFLGAFLSCNFTELFERELKLWFRLGQIYEARRIASSGHVIKEMDR